MSRATVQSAEQGRARDTQVRSSGSGATPQGSVVERQIRTLQRAAGNRAVAGMLRVQRYHTVDSANVRTEIKDQQRLPFMQQGDEMQLVDRDGDKRGKTLRFPIAQTGTGDRHLHVADDCSLAINADAAEPKDFFASSAVVRAANAQLDAVNSPIELFTVGNAVTVPGPDRGTEIKLGMVQPKVRGEGGPDAGAFAEIAVDICRDMAKYVMANGITHAVLGTGDSRTQVPIKVGSSIEVSGMHQLAEGLSEGTISLEEAKQRLSNTEKSPQSGKTYGKALQSGDVRTRSSGLGLNEDARAQVGEGYVTQSIRSTEGEGGTKREYSVNQQPFDRQFVWGYHFGAVVAEATDKADQILLENYSRKADLADGFARLLAQLKTDFARDIHGITLEGSLEEQISAILKHLDTMDGKASNTWRSFTTNELQKLQTLWYFRMVGKKAGQSFHEQTADSGYFVNPLTVAVAHQQFRGTKLRFGLGEEQPDQVVVNNVTSMASGALADIRQGCFPGRLHITGYRSQTWSPWTAYQNAGIGGRRARAVAGLFQNKGFPRDKIVEVDGGGTGKFGSWNDIVEVRADG